MNRYQKKEQECIDRLISRLGGKYKTFYRNIRYPRVAKHPQGEIDLIGELHTGKFDAFEIKAKDHLYARIRAKKQLCNAKEYFPNHINELFLYTCYEDELLRYDLQTKQLYLVFEKMKFNQK